MASRNLTEVRTDGTSELQENQPQTPNIQLIPENPFDRAEPPNEIVESGSMANTNFEAYKQNASTTGATESVAPTGDAANLLRGLTIKTDWGMRRTGSTASLDTEYRLRTSNSAASLPRRISSVRSRLHSTAGSVSPGSIITSPQIAAMLDITPLPSPTMGPLESWKMLARTRSRASSTSSRPDVPMSAGTPVFAMLSPTSPRRKAYPGLQAMHGRTSSEDKTFTEDESRARTRSISDYVPEGLSPPKPRHVAVSTAGPPKEPASAHPALHREEYLGAQRGLEKPRPVSESVTYSAQSIFGIHEDEPVAKRPKLELYNVQSINNGSMRQYEEIRLLGQGTFSKVYLAVRQIPDRKESVDYRQESTNMAGVRARSRRLVAVKVVEPGPAGGADAERIEVSLKREVEIMKAIKHPSIVHLKAFGTEASGRALLVMNYCPGGDLFELASKPNAVMTPPLIRRIFSELVSAVRYLHQKYIVHRDIKLENVLLNIPVQVHNDVADWQTLDRAVVTLTDLGLSRQIPHPPESPLLETRCGSEDYAAPEILMGQPYDGRMTDAWALGVLLYALMEGRLPFDPLPRARGDPATLRARTPHRIARCEWAWVRYGDEDGDWDPKLGKELEGGMKCVDALLRRSSRRTGLAEIRDWPWVRDGIQIDGGLRWVEEEGM